MLRFLLSALVLSPVALAQAPQFAAPVRNPFGLTRAGAEVRSTPAIVDLDADGDRDVVSGDLFGGLYYFQNTAGPGARPMFSPATPLPFGFSTPSDRSSAPAFADFDGDGDTDLLIGEDLGNCRYFENTAGPGVPGVFAAGVVNPFGLRTGNTLLAPAAGDIDGDGDVDVLAGDGGGNFTFYLNTAGAGVAPVFAAPVQAPYGLRPLPMQSLPTIVDLDGDGDADVLAAGNTAFFYFENTAGPNATPAFATGVGNPFGLMPASNSPAPAVGDLDGDADLDVLAGESIGNFYYFENVRPVAVESAPEARIAWGAPAPNPAAGRASVSVTLAQAQAVRVDVVDVLGRVVLTARLDAPAGVSTVRLDVSALASGTYTVRALGQSRRLTVAR